MAPHNLYIENGKISALTSWWKVSAEPLFTQARTPKLVKHQGKQIFKLPDDYESQDEAKQAFVRNALAGTAQEWMYDHARANWNPALQRVYDYPNSLLLRRTMSFAQNTWDGDIALLRDCLMKVAEYVHQPPLLASHPFPLIPNPRNWTSVAPNAGPCPISFTPEDYALIYRNAPKYNDAADFWDEARDFVQEDGWVRNEHYDLMLEFFGQVREEGLKGLEGEEREEWERVMRWAKREGKD